MCRYAMARYKPHLACFNCRKTFKRRLMWDINRGDKTANIAAKCPQCGGLMADMGLDFASPKKDDIREWEYIRSLYSVGMAFHSCGCTGPGYIPNSSEKLIAYFNEKLEVYNAELSFWRQRKEPENEKEVQRENSKYWSFIGQIPYELRPKKGAIKNEEAKQYWFDRIKEVEQKLKIVSKKSD